MFVEDRKTVAGNHKTVVVLRKTVVRNRKTVASGRETVACNRNAAAAIHGAVVTNRKTVAIVRKAAAGDHEAVAATAPGSDERSPYGGSRKLPAMTTFHTLIRDVPDFPKPGVVFKDIGPLLADPAGFGACIEALVTPWRDTPVDAICGVESRGFIFGAAMALAMNTGFVPLRKVGKLPPPTLGVDYDLEYGSARLEVGAEGIARGAHVLLVDDVLATGGTFDAARRLLEQAGANVVGAGVVIEIDALRGRERWPAAIPLRALLHC